MRLIRSKFGQSNAEYAVLFAIVVGGAVGMQSFVKARLQGAMKQNADDFLATAGGAKFHMNITSKSNSTSDITMKNSDSGIVDIDGSSKSLQIKE